MKIHPLILVIDDESKIRRFVCQSLEREGFDVASAGDGEEALEVFEALSEKPDLVIVDDAGNGWSGFFRGIQEVSFYAGYFSFSALGDLCQN